MAELAVQVKIILGPDHGNGTVLQHFGIPHAFEPLVFAGGQMSKPLLVRGDSSGSVGSYRNERSLRSKERPGGSGVVSSHGVKQALHGRGWSAGVVRCGMGE